MRIVRRRERTPNLIGRESALSALGEALGGVADAGSLVLVRGEVGIGKTRLLEEFAARVAGDAHVVRGGCVEGVSYAPWTEALRRLLSTADVVAADELPRRVPSQIARLATRQIALTPLEEDSTAEMAEILLGPDASPADVRRIAHDADGNPLFVEELVAALGTTGVPQTVRDLMLARFSVLDEPSRHLVRTAAVIGATAPQAWLAAAAGLDDSATRGGARAAGDRGLLVAGGGGA